MQNENNPPGNEEEKRQQTTMPVSINDLLKHLKPEVQMNLTKLHKEVIHIVYMRIFIDIESKRALEF